MDNASKNAGDMISSLQLQYNRGRQAAITNELVDIITGLFCPLIDLNLWSNYLTLCLMQARVLYEHFVRDS
jgi:hypothetical protein